MKRIFLLVFTLSCSSLYHRKNYVISQSPTEEKIGEPWDAILQELEQDLTTE